MSNNLRKKYLVPFLESLDPQLAPQTIYGKQLYIGQLLDFLEDRYIENLENFDINLVYDFIASKPEWASTTVSGAQFQIRSFFDFLYDRDIISYYGRRVFPVILSNKRDRILSFYETDEIKAMVTMLLNCKFQRCDLQLSDCLYSNVLHCFPAFRAYQSITLQTMLDYLGRHTVGNIVQSILVLLVSLMNCYYCNIFFL